MDIHFWLGSAPSVWLSLRTITTARLCATMEAKSRRQKQRGDALTSLNRAIDALDLARDSTNAKQAKGAFGCASALLTATRVGSFPVCV